MSSKSETTMSTVSTGARKRKKVAWWIARYMILLAASFMFLFPIFWVTSNAFKYPRDFNQSPPLYLPSEAHLGNFERVLFTTSKALVGLRDSMIVSVGATAMTLIVGVSAAYSMARFSTGGSHLSFWVLSQRMLPAVAMLLPIFLLFRSLKLIDTHIGLILLYSLAYLPFAIWMLRSYVNDLSAEIEESALIDGATRFQLLRYITLPLLLPGIIATGAFVFIAAWSEFLFASILSRSSVQTLPVLILTFFGEQAALLGEASAVAVIATFPIIILGLLVQRHFISGLSMGAVK